MGERRERAYYALDINTTMGIISKMRVGRTLNQNQAAYISQIISNASQNYQLKGYDGYSLIGGLKDTRGRISGLYVAPITKFNRGLLTIEDNDATKYHLSKVKRLIKELNLGRGRNVLRAAKQYIYAQDGSYKATKQQYQAAQMNQNSVQKRQALLMRKYGTTTDQNAIATSIAVSMRAGLTKKLTTVDDRARRLAKLIAAKTQLLNSNLNKESLRVKVKGIKEKQLQSTPFEHYSFGGANGVVRKGVDLNQLGKFAAPEPKYTALKNTSINQSGSSFNSNQGDSTNMSFNNVSGIPLSQQANNTFDNSMLNQTFLNQSNIGGGEQLDLEQGQVEKIDNRRANLLGIIKNASGQILKLVNRTTKINNAERQRFLDEELEPYNKWLLDSLLDSDPDSQTFQDGFNLLKSKFVQFIKSEADKSKSGVSKLIKK